MTYKEFLYETYGRLNAINTELSYLINCINDESAEKDVHERFIDVNSDVDNLCKDIKKQIIELELKDGFEETNYVREEIKKEIDNLSDNEKIDRVIKRLGFSSYYAGTEMIKKAILIWHIIGERCQITKEIYQDLTPRNPDRAEQSIRFAIKNAYECDPQKWKKIFGNALKVTNKNVIALIEELIWK